MLFLCFQYRDSKKSNDKRRSQLFESNSRSTRFICLLFILLLWTSNAVQNTNTSALGNELATLSDGGVFGNPMNSYRQDFCELYKRRVNESGIPGIQSALNGIELAVATFPGKYFIYDDEKGINPVYPGIHAKMLDYIAERGNFTWRNSFAVFDKKGSNITEILDWGTQKYDLMVGTYTPSTQRMKLGVSFVDGHFNGGLIMVRDVPPTETVINWFNWMAPFKPSVWYAIIGTVIFSAFVHQIIESIGAKGREEKSFRVWLMDNLYLSFINFTGNYSYEPTTLAGRFFGTSYAFWAMLITAAYTANLASLLVGREVAEPKVETILDVVKHDFPLCVQVGSFAEDHLRRKYPEVIPLLVPVPSNDLYDSLNRGDCEILIAYKQDFMVSRKQAEANPKCTIERQGREIKPLEDAFATRHDPGILCTDLVNEMFNYYIKEMDGEGILDELWEEHSRYFADEGHCTESDSELPGLGRRFLERYVNAPGFSRRFLKGASVAGASAGGAVSTLVEEEEEEVRALTIKDMAGTILFQVVVSVIAILIALVSGFEAKTKQKRTVRKKTMRDTRRRTEDNGCVREDDELCDYGGTIVDGQLVELNARVEILSDMVRELLHDKRKRNDQHRRTKPSSVMTGTYESVRRDDSDVTTSSGYYSS